MIIGDEFLYLYDSQRIKSRRRMQESGGMLILAVDTTTTSGSVALLDSRRLISEVCLESPLTHSERLIPAIEFILKSNNLDIGQVDGFAVAAGPGSFTGIRIGLSTVKAFAYASRKPVAGVSSLSALALKLSHFQARLVCPVMDAKRGEVFAALFESKSDKLTEIIPQGAYPPERFFSLLPSNRVIHFIGNGLAAYKDRLLDYIHDKARFSDRSLFIAYEVGLLGHEILSRGMGAGALDIQPLYLRKSQAEERHR